MAMKLLGRTGHVAGRDVSVPHLLRIGAADDNEFRVVLRGISRYHARILKDGTHYWLEDAGSTNGTFLNGQRVTRERLQHLDVITLGRDVDLIVVASDAGTSVPVRQVTDAWFEWNDGPEKGMRVDIPPGQLTVGRVPPSNVLVDSPVVSQLHARLHRTVDHVLLQDLESVNGTFVNGHRVTTSTVLRNGDNVTVAGIRQFKVHIKGDSGRPVAQDAVISPSMTFDQEWQTRLVWSADELAALEGERKQSVEAARHVRAAMASPAASKAATPKAPPAAAKPPAPKPPAAAKPPAAKPPAAAPKPAAVVAKPPAPAPKPVEPPPPPPVAKVEPPAVAEVSPAPEVVAPIATAPPPEPVAPRPVLEAAAPVAAEAPAPFVDEEPPTVKLPDIDFDATQFMQPAVRAIRLTPAPGTTGGAGPVVLERGRHVVGRANDAALTINNRQVSRNHAVLLVTDTSVTLEDWKSANGTFLNMETVEGQPVTLKTGDTIAFGSVEFTVELLT